MADINDVAVLCAANRLKIDAILQHLEEIGLPIQQAAAAESEDAAADAATIRANYMRRSTSGDIPNFTPAQLAAAPTGTPNVTGVVSLGPLSESPIEIRQHSAFRNPDGSPISLLVVDDDGNAIDLSAADLLMNVYYQGKPATVLWSFVDGEGGELSVTGAESNEILLDADDTHTAVAGAYAYIVWDVADAEHPVPVFGGPLTIKAEAVATPLAES